MTYQDNGYNPRVGYTQQFRQAAAGLDPDLMHWWTFDDVYTDVVDENYTFVPQAGTPTFVSGVWNNAVRVTQTPSNGNLLVDVTTPTTIDGGASFTVTSWFKQNTASSSSSTMYVWGNSPIGNCWFLDNLNTQSEAEFFIAGTSGSISCKSAYISDTGVWIFHAATWDEDTDTATKYHGVNGASLVTTNGVEASWTGPRKTFTATDLRCGYFTGGDVTIDDCRIYRVAKDAAAIQALYDEGKAALGL
jgi:hypothetical protein